MPSPLDSHRTVRQVRLAGSDLTLHSLPVLLGERAERVPYCTKVLLENLLRHEDGVHVTGDDIDRLAGRARAGVDDEVAFSPERILMQDFTGVPCIADLGA